MAGQTTSNLGSAQGPMDAMRRKYINEKVFSKRRSDWYGEKSNKKVLSPVDEGDAANESYIYSKSVRGSDLKNERAFNKKLKPNSDTWKWACSKTMDWKQFFMLW